MQYHRLNAAVLTIAFFIMTTVNAQDPRYWVDSQSGDVAVGSCDFSHIWDICTDSGCPGQWEKLGRVNLPCIIAGRTCSPQEPQYFCRRISGGYNGWGARNGMLDAFFATNYCYDDGNFFFVGGKGTHEWVALRGSDGAWINVEFKIGINNC